MIEDSTITCPECGDKEIERMPPDACVILYECKSCGAVLRPKPGDCCIFCSYGSVPCLPIQAGQSSCARTRAPRPGSSS
jgi:hypothetical protein